MQTINVAIHSKSVRKCADILARETAVPDAGREETLFTVTGQAPDGCQVDLKVCNGDPPWCEAVLFTKEGYEMGCSDVMDELPEDGGHIDLVVAGETYRVVVTHI